MTNNDELAMKLKAAADKAVDNFDPNMFILTRDMVALLAGRDADKKRIAELEARTVSVKLPPKVDSSNLPFAAHSWNSCIDEVTKRLAAAGIKLEVGE